MGEGDLKATGTGPAESAVTSANMPPTLLQRMAQLGFKYPVFLSWPHEMQRRGVEIVQALASELEDVFKDDGGGQVFFDRERIKPSYRWDPLLRKSLARSAVIFAFLLPRYFMSDYCRIEWNIGEQLERLRLAGNAERSIVVPIRLSKTVDLPKEVSAIQFDDEFQQLLVYGKDVTTHENWRSLVSRLRDLVFEILEIVVQSARDWPAEEQLAQTVGPKTFTWVVNPASFPRFKKVE
jgi:hypothetical protein